MAEITVQNSYFMHFRIIIYMSGIINLVSFSVRLNGKDDPAINS